MSIDQVSAAIGELKAEATASKNQRAALFDQVGDIKKMVADLTVVIQTNITKDDIKIAEIEKDIKSHGSAIGDLKKFKQLMDQSMLSGNRLRVLTGYNTLRISLIYGLKKS